MRLWLPITSDAVAAVSLFSSSLLLGLVDACDAGDEEEGLVAVITASVHRACELAKGGWREGGTTN